MNVEELKVALGNDPKKTVKVWICMEGVWVLTDILTITVTGPVVTIEPELTNQRALHLS